MAYSVLTAKADLTSIIHGTQINKVNNINGLFNRTAKQILLDIDPQETKRIVELASPIYSQVYDYACPVDLKGNRVIDIRPQVNRRPSDIISQTYNRAFDATKSIYDQFTINFNSSIKTIRIANSSAPAGLVLNEADDLTSNGTWTLADDATDLAVDNQNYVSGSGSLKFNLTALGTDGVVKNSTMTAQDLTDYLNQGTLFLYVYLPTASDFTSVKLTWGSSSSDTWSKTVTSTQQNTTFQNGWNLLSFNWLGATQVGTPDVTKVNYLEVQLNFNGTAQTAVRIDNIVCRMGDVMEIEYYSKYLFRNASTSAFQETVLDDSDLINLDTESYNLFLAFLAYLTAQQVQGKDASLDLQFFQKSYTDLLERYRGLYKSEVSLPRSTYYQMKKPGYGRFFNRRTQY